MELISETVLLSRKGKNYWGLCPFHQEKTASFSVIPDKQRFYCFGCHAKGDIFDFIQLRDRLDFKAAKDYIAERAGLSVYMSPAERLVISKAKQKREAQQKRQAMANKLIKEQWNRLIDIEQWCHLFLKHVQGERCLDRPGPVWATQTLPIVESLLNEMEQGNDKERLQIALHARGWAPWKM